MNIKRYKYFKKKFKTSIFDYDITEDLMNINEAVKVHCFLMKHLKFLIAISRKSYKIN